MKNLNEYLVNETKSTVAFETIVNKDNVDILKKVIEYVEKNNECHFRFTSEIDGSFKSIDIWKDEKWIEIK